MVIYGCYRWNDLFFKLNLYKLLKRRINSKKILNLINSFEQGLLSFNFLKRKNNPLKLFYTTEFLRSDYFPEADFVISQDLGITRENHLYDGNWKDTCDWSHYGFYRPLTQYAKRLGKFIDVNTLTKPQGIFFMSKPRNFFIMTSHLYEPRKTFYDVFSKNFRVDGYGPWFNRNIQRAEESVVTKLDIMTKYAFNLCPENSIYPGYTSDRVPGAIFGKCLPITWADQNINYEFNPKAFVNLNDHFHDNFESIIENLKSDEYLKRFSQEPLLLKKPTLEKEIKFVEKILGCL